jgi:hypothetical protein
MIVEQIGCLEDLVIDSKEFSHIGDPATQYKVHMTMEEDQRDAERLYEYLYLNREQDWRR